MRRSRTLRWIVATRRACARLRADPFLLRDCARCALRSRFNAFRRGFGATTSSNTAPSNTLASVPTPRSNATVVSLTGSGVGRGHSNCADSSHQPNSDIGGKAGRMVQPRTLGIRQQPQLEQSAHRSHGGP